MDVIIKNNTTEENDIRLRILYLYQLLLTQSDEDHPLTTKEITDHMEKHHGIHMHRTTVPSDIALLKAAGFEIIAERKRAWNYYLADRIFSIPELKLLIDAVQSSKFITDKKSQLLINKLFSLTSEPNAVKLKRTVHITGKIKSENEKGYYIVDAINEAMNTGVKISFHYFDYGGNKEEILKNDGNAYVVSPYDLIWDGDFYYLIGFCDNRNDIRTFRVDRIKKQPEMLLEKMVPQPKDYDVVKYTQEVFRMFSTEDAIEVTLLCNNSVMKSIIDQFGIQVQSTPITPEEFQVKVKVCTSPTFYRWVFGFDGKIRIINPEETIQEYLSMLERATHRYMDNNHIVQKAVK